MSSQLKENKQQESKRHIDADNLLNKHIFNTLAYTFGGYAAGMATSLLFKRKAGIPLLMAGAGAGYGLSTLYGDMENLKKFQSQGESHTLKRDDLIGTKDWEKYQTKEEYQHSTKGPRFGGSDDSDDKSGSGKTEQKKTQKDSKTEHEVKTGEKATHKKDESKETEKSGKTEKSEKGVAPQKDQNKLANIEGKAYSGNGDAKNKETDHKSKEHDSKGKQSETISKEKESKSNESQSKSIEKAMTKSENDAKNKQSETSKEKSLHNLKLTPEQRQTNPNYQGTNEKNDAVTSGKSEGGVAHSFVEGHAKGGGNAPGEYKEGTSLLNRRGGENTKKVNEQLSNNRPSEQDKIGQSATTGRRNEPHAKDEGTAGGQFRGKSSAGSQTNVVLE